MFGYFIMIPTLDSVGADHRLAQVLALGGEGHGLRGHGHQRCALPDMPRSSLRAGQAAVQPHALQGEIKLEELYRHV